MVVSEIDHELLKASFSLKEIDRNKGEKEEGR